MWPFLNNSKKFSLVSDAIGQKASTWADSRGWLWVNDTCRIVGWLTRHGLALAYVCFFVGTVTVNLRVDGHPVFFRLIL